MLLSQALSDLANIVVCDGAPRSIGNRRGIAAGDICHASDQANNTFICMAVKLQGYPSISGYATLSGAQHGKIINILNAFYIGRAAVVPLVEPETLV